MSTENIAKEMTLAEKLAILLTSKNLEEVKEGFRLLMTSNIKMGAKTMERITEEVGTIQHD